MLLAVLEALLRASGGVPAGCFGLSLTDGHGAGPLAAGSSCTAGGGVPAAAASPWSERDFRPSPLSAFVSERRAMLSDAGYYSAAAAAVL
jgi:hypothetical protein